ncbi:MULTISPECIES: BA14K family protein [Rhizobium]|uniref:Lectin-like protein BA14k n=1 Tax=Rhizobium miluonense TaxID=411945 RepID=A0A1C3W9V6_9HYPH|nr:BA14K family protein [Rhizobium miluonense]SCB36839.1 BA14K-like protein [Rhizobium miluonense]
MFTIARSIAAAGFGLLLAAGAAMPAGAITVPALPVPQQSDVIQVHDHGHWHHHNHWGSGHRLHGSDSYYDDDSDSGVLFKSFVTGTLFSWQRSRGYYDGHARACANRYRSYDPADNTYQPSQGPRRECR